MRRAWWLSAMLLFAGCELWQCAPFPEPDDNQPPIAKLVWPQLWDVHEPVPFDGTQTVDLEGPVFRYEMTFGDGTEVRTSDDGLFEHSYGAAGSYDFVFVAQDEHGAKGVVEGSVTVVDNLDDPACTCDLPCFAPARCTPTGCLIGRASTAPGQDAGAAVTVVELAALDCGDEGRPDAGPGPLSDGGLAP